MTVTNDLARVQYTGNGASKVFSTGFAFQHNNEVKVILTEVATLIETVWAENVQYTLTGATGADVDPTPGTVTAVTAPAVGFTLTIMRDVQFIQDLDGTTLSTMDAGDQETAYDKIWHALAQLKDGLARTVHGSDGAITTIPGTWIPLLAVASDVGSRQVVQVTGWTGGEGDAPAAGMYLGPIGYVTNIAQATDISGRDGTNGTNGTNGAQGPQGATGAQGPVGPVGPAGPQGVPGPVGPGGTGTGDMLRANNLNDVLSASASRNNLGLKGAAILDVGTTTGTVAAGDDARFASLAASDALKAPLASPTFTGDPKAPTPTAGDNDTSIATTAFVATAVAPLAPLASPALTGNPTAPTQAPGDSDTSIATTGFVAAAITAAIPVAATAAEFRSNSAPTKMLTPGAVWGAAGWANTPDTSGTITPDMSAGIDFYSTVSGAGRTLANPTNVKAGQKGVIFLIQDATGGRTITTWGNLYNFPGGIKPVLSSAANAVDMISYVVSGGLSIFCTFNADFR